MNNSLLHSNLDLIQRHDPSLFEKISSIDKFDNYAVAPSKSGVPTLITIDNEGIKKQVHSNYDPVEEASRYIDKLDIVDSFNFIVLGFGLGYQVLELVRKTSGNAKIYIFEKDPELLALAIRTIDLSIVFKHPGVKIKVNFKPPDISALLTPEQANFTFNKYRLLKQKSLVDCNSQYYGALLQEIENYFKESKINFDTHSVHSKLYYKNIFSNFRNLLLSPGIESLKGCMPGIPAIICSAGPSLDKNIQLIKSARDRVFLIAVATALKPLLHNDIEPDIVVSIDPDDLTINSFDLSSDNHKFLLVYNPAVPNIIPETFPSNRLAFDSDACLAKWFKEQTEEKGSLGKVSSVAHSAVKLGQFMGCSPVMLVGQDLSFCNERLHCKHTFYYDEYTDKVARFHPFSYWGHDKYINFGSNLTYKADMFGKSVTSTLAMDSYNNIFSKNFEGSRTIINATEGGLAIKGVQSVSLREAIHFHCKDRVHKHQKPVIPLNMNFDKSLKSLKTSLSDQIKILRKIFEELNILKSDCLIPSKQNLESKQAFVINMGNLYKSILENQETAFLLQEYDFAGFSDWYRENSQIMLKKDIHDKASLIDEEYERDIKLFDVLIDAVDYLIQNFEKSLALEL